MASVFTYEECRPRNPRGLRGGQSSAGGGDRTHTGLLSPQDFKSCASASFATPAYVAMLRDGNDLPSDIETLSIDSALSQAGQSNDLHELACAMRRALFVGLFETTA